MSDTRTPYQQRRDALAKVLAASLMGMINDAAGTGLPEDCWHQMRSKADAVLFIISTGADRESAGNELERALRGYRGPG